MGINYETTEGSSSEIQTSLTVGMEAGFKFMGSSGSVSVEASVAKTLTRDVQSTYGVDYGIENHTTCTAEGKEGAGLYQWIVSSDDFMKQAFTWHTVCRTGELWNKPPECPYFSCANADCSVCNLDWASDDSSSEANIDGGGFPESAQFTPVKRFVNPFEGLPLLSEVLPYDADLMMLESSSEETQNTSPLHSQALTKEANVRKTKDRDNGQDVTTEAKKVKGVREAL